MKRWYPIVALLLSACADHKAWEQPPSEQPQAGGPISSSPPSGVGGFRADSGPVSMESMIGPSVATDGGVVGVVRVIDASLVVRPPPSRDAGPSRVDGAADAGPCPPSFRQSERPDCPLYCPPQMPGEGEPCADRALNCAYGELQRCECARDSFTWECVGPDCRWDAVAAAWVGNGCGECPFVDEPQNQELYGSCSPEAPECWWNTASRFYCDQGRYRFYITSPP